MNLQEIAKPTYRKRSAPRSFARLRTQREAFVVFDKRTEKYRLGGAVPRLAPGWTDSIESATKYDTSDSAHNVINYMIGEGYNSGALHKDVWWHYYRELDPAGEMDLSWSDIGKYFEIQKIHIQTKIVGTVELGS